jgi:hypothetical protein
MKLLAVFCKFCKEEIDEDTCYCGEDVMDHHAWSGHMAVTLGCKCSYDNSLDTYLSEDANF